MSRAIDKLPISSRPCEIQVIVTSKSRVGTLSMYEAFKILGYRPYHLYETTVTHREPHMNVFDEAVSAKYLGMGKPYGKAEFDRWFANYDVVIEVAALFLEEMVEYYPDAQFLHTERDVDAWYRSMDNTLAKGFKAAESFPLNYLRHFDGFLDSFCRIQITMRKAVCNGKAWDESADYCKEDFLEYNRKVRQLIPQDKLAVFKLEDGFGWEQICPYLKQPIPEVTYPIGNMPAQFQNSVQKLLLPSLLKGAVVTLSVPIIFLSGIGIWYL